MSYIRVWVELPLWHGHKKQHWYAGLCIFSCVTLPQLFVETNCKNWAKNLMPGSLYLSHPISNFETPRPIQWQEIHKPFMPSCDKYLLMAFQKLLRSDLYKKDPSILWKTAWQFVSYPTNLGWWHASNHTIAYMFIQNAMTLPRHLQPLSGNSLMVSFRTHDSSPCFRAPLWWHDRIENRILWSEVRSMKLNNLLLLAVSWRKIIWDFSCCGWRNLWVPCWNKSLVSQSLQNQADSKMVLRHANARSIKNKWILPYCLSLCFSAHEIQPYSRYK